MKFQKRFLLLGLLVLVLAGLKYHVSSDTLDSVETFRGAIIEEDVFYPMIAQSMNENALKITLNDLELSNKNDGVYVRDDLSIMVPIEALMEGLHCSARIYDDQYLLILQRDLAIRVYLYEDRIEISDGTSLEVSGTDIKKKQVYVALQPLKDYLSFDLNIDKENNMVYASTTLEESFLPEAFDLRSYDRVGAVGNQGSYGTCWAFASLSAVESSMLPEEEARFAVDHMSLRNSFSSDLSKGGEYTMGMAYLTSWQGPVYEEDDPYGDGVSPEGLKAEKHVQEIQLLENPEVDEVKEAVFCHGAVQTSLYFNSSLYFDRTNYAYYSDGEYSVNHDIVIIGWDDGYPAENFLKEPEGDGAWICMNSWGESWGDNGMFYVSYYDTSICGHCLSYTKVENEDNYDNIYQSDLCGWGGRLGYNKSTIYAANVYTPDSDEYLKAVGFYATGKNTAYEIYVVPTFEDVSSLNEGWKVAKGVKKNAGYYTVEFKNSIQLYAGKAFAIVIKIDTPDSSRPMAVEYAGEDSDIKIDLSDGQGYISPDGSLWKSAEDTKNCNLCLKAYTVEQ